MKKWLTKRNIVVGCGLGVVGLGVWVWMGGAKPKEIKTVPVVRKDLRQTFTASGKIVAGRMATLNFSGTGRLAYVGTDEGERVRAGQLLMSQDLGDVQAAERAAYYKYLAADANAKKVEDSVKGHDYDESFTQKNDRVAAQTARDIAYDTWLTAQRTVRNSRLTAPFAGVVTQVTATAVGDTVGTGDGVTILDPESVYFEVELDETDVSRVGVGTGVKVKLDSYPGVEFGGAVAEIAYVAHTSSSGATVFSAKIKVESAELDKLRVGMNGDMEMVVGEAKNVLVVPAESVVSGELGVVRNGRVVRMKVETGIESDTETEIKSGVNEGEQVWIK